jgi:hypothetical protein
MQTVERPTPARSRPCRRRVDAEPHALNVASYTCDRLVAGQCRVPGQSQPLGNHSSLQREHQRTVDA